HRNGRVSYGGREGVPGRQSAGTRAPPACRTAGQGRRDQRRATRERDARTRSTRQHARRRPPGAGAGRPLPGLHRARHAGSGRSHPEDRAGACDQRKGNRLRDLLVMKFGGTSVGSAERMRVSAGLAATEQKKRPVAIVVSAMSKITDLLLDTMRHAEAGDRAGMEANLNVLRKRHEDACRELLPHAQQPQGLEQLHDVIDEFDRIVGGMAMLGERPPRSVDEAVAVGERLTVVLVSAYLNATGTPACGVNARDVVVTDAVFGNASPLMEPTRVKARD